MTQPPSHNLIEAILSPTERRLWTLRSRHGLELRNVFECRILEDIDLGRLRSALNRVVNRHDVLRSQYLDECGEGRVAARVASSLEAPIRAFELGGSGSRGGLAQAERFDSTAGPEEAFGARFAIAKLSESHFHLSGTIPSIQADGRSIVQFIAEVESAYRGSGDAGRSSSGAQFRDIAQWISNAAGDELGLSARNFWRSYLSQVPWEADLPIEKTASGARESAFQAASIAWDLPSPIEHEALRRGGEGEGWLRIQLATATAAWLSNIGSRRRVFLGVAFDGRAYDELRDAIGPYEKYVPIAIDVEGATTFEHLSQVIARRLEELSDWQEWFDLSLANDHDSNGAALVAYPVCVDVRRSPFPSPSSFEVSKLLSAADSFGIKLSCEIRERRVAAEIHYNRALYASTSMRRLGSHLSQLLALARNQPRNRVAHSSFISPAERRWHETDGQAWPSVRCLPETFERQAAARPEAVALIQDDCHLTFARMNRLANRLARRLQEEATLAPDTLIALRMKTGWEVAVAILAVLKTGAAYVPIDPGWPQNRVDELLRDAGVAAIVTCDAKEDGESPAAAPLIRFDGEELSRDEGLGDDDPGTPIDPESLSYVLFTSGTSGKPKGVMVTHRGLANYLSWAASYYRIAQGRGSLVHSPVTFDFTLTCLLAPLTVGKPVQVCATEMPLQGLADALTRSGDISLIKLTPTSVDPLRRLVEAGACRCRVGSIVLGGEALVASRSLSSLARSLQAAIVNEYGPTECVVGSTVHCIRANDAVEGAIPIGRPIANTQVRLSKSNGAPAETWVQGEIEIAGWGLARGYLNDPASTAASFQPQSNATEPGQRLYRTGDLARCLTDGSILYLGRRDSQVKLRGYRIELAEVEAAMRTHPAVADCVAALADRPESHARLIAFLVAEDGSRISHEEIRSHLAASLPDYMIPSAFHTLGQLPATANGKIDAQALQAAIGQADSRGKPVKPPSRDIERILHRVWKEVLGREDIGVDDNFFELGGDSILSIQVLARANEAGLRLRPKHIQDHLTIAQLADAAEKSLHDLSQAADIMSGEVPLAPIQRRFFEWGLQDPHHYNQSVLVSLPKRWKRAHFQEGVQALAEHHDALRLYFEKRGSEYRQFCSERFERDFIEFEDLGPEDEEQWKSGLAQAAKRAQQSIRLEKAPLLRLVHFSGTKRDHLYVVAHHLIVDHVSWTFLLADLRSALEQAAAGGAVQLPRKSASYSSWIDYWKGRALRNRLKQEAAYWLSHRWSRLPECPRDHSLGEESNLVQDEDHVSLRLDRERTRGLLRDAVSAFNARPIELMLAAYALAYSGWSGSRSMAVDLESHGRQASEGAPDVSRTIGWFTSLFPVLLSLTRPSDFGQSIQEVKEALRAVPESGAGFGALRSFSLERDTGREQPVLASAQVAFNYLGQVGRTVAPDSPFQWVRHSPAENRSGRNRRPHLLEISAFVDEGRLRIGITFGRKVHLRRSIEGLAQALADRLKAVADHCSQTRSKRFAPSDFPLTKITQEALDRIIDSNPEAEDIYPLSHTQKGMLFHSVREAAASPYLVQLCVEFSGKLDESLFERSWRRVIARHTILRTSFVWESVPEPLQIVHRSVATTFLKEDWSSECEQDAPDRFECWIKAQRDQGMDLSRPPLTRFALLRLGESRYRFVWTYHHILLDGWSTSRVLGEVLSTYEALQGSGQPPAPPARPYRDYIEWLLAKPWDETVSYWRKALQGVGAGTRLALPMPRSRSADSAAPHVEELLELGKHESRALHDLASRLQMTLNTVVQAAWAFVLSRYAGSDDVIFGVTVSGRPFQLYDVENRVGLFINTLPLRVRVDHRASLGSYLASVAQSLREMLEHDFAPLFEIHRICGLPARQGLFDTVLVYENYPTHTDLGRLRDQLRVDEVRSAEQTNYPLTLVVGGQGSDLSIKAVFDSTRLNLSVIGQILGHLRDTLGWMTQAEESRLGRCVDFWSSSAGGRARPASSHSSHS